MKCKRVVSFLLTLCIALLTVLPTAALAAPQTMTVSIAVSDYDTVKKEYRCTKAVDVPVTGESLVVKDALDAAVKAGLLTYTYEDSSGFVYVTSISGISDDGSAYSLVYDKNDQFASTGDWSKMTDSISVEPIASGDKLLFARYTADRNSPLWADVVAGAKTNVASHIGKIAASYKNLRYTDSASDWAALDMAAAGKAADAFAKDSAKASFARSSLQKMNAKSATDVARISLMLTALGYDASEQINSLSGMNLSDINSFVFTLNAYDSAHYALPAGARNTRETLVQAIIAKQNADGGWGYARASEPSMTGMALTALAPYDTAKTAIDKGVNYLSSIQDTNGGYVSFGAANSNDAAMVIVALSALGIDADTDGRFIKNKKSVLDSLLSFVTSNGQVGYDSKTEANALSTEQALRALAAYNNFRMDKPCNIYAFADNTSQLSKLSPNEKGWQKTSAGWVYYDQSGTILTGWQKIDGQWYYLDNNGIMQTDWIKLEGSSAGSSRWYYLNKSGSMATGWQKIGSKWYEFKSSGVWVEKSTSTGWKKYARGWSFNTNKTWAKGWTMIGGQWYYFDSSMYMKTGWRKISGKWYYLKSSGTMATGWQKVGASWYYLNSNGTMATKWININGSWYYLKPSGTMATGWIKQGGKQYYLNPNGTMATGTQTIKGKTYTFDASGVWVK